MSFSASPDLGDGQLEGVRADELARRLQLPRVVLLASVGSTLDVAHRIAPDAASGTLIVADEQTAGRGRHGRRWRSAAGAGLWLTLIERPTDARALDVLALRCGLYAAESLDALAGTGVCLKWPNDLYAGGRKLAGILIETRWRGTAPDWVAIGFGVNVRQPEGDDAAGLREGATRLEGLDVLVPALRRAAAASRHLTADELARWQRRDVATGRAVSHPVAGQVAGVEPDGQLVVTTPDGRTTRHRTGSLTFADPSALTCS
ncbi:MAG: biotin/acetyl-CoA-carboxylase ligase [Gemmatimonadetes bacterium]|nr:biotin/acetyl-CoA-carboxylase ligase [Gemmatimonadota bacterium]